MLAYDTAARPRPDHLQQHGAGNASLGCMTQPVSCHLTPRVMLGLETRELVPAGAGHLPPPMALPRRMLQVAAGFNFNPGPGGQPGKQPWASQPPPGIGRILAPAPAPGEQLVPSFSGVAMASVVASEFAWRTRAALRSSSTVTHPLQGAI